MASHSTIFVTLLLFISFISGAPLESTPLTFVRPRSGTPLKAGPSTFSQPPPHISLTVLSADGKDCFGSTPNVDFIESGNELWIGYDNFKAYTETGVNFGEDKACKVTLQVTYPAGYAFWIHDPEFRGDATMLSDRGKARFTAYSYFGPANSLDEPIPKMDSDIVELQGPYDGNYVAFAPPSEVGDGTRIWESTCGATNANLTVITRLNALGGEFNEADPTPAKVNIDHKVTLYEVAWISC